MKIHQRDQARRLRQDGALSLRAIAEQLDVAPSSVRRWTSDIELAEDQVERLRSGNPAHDRQHKGAATVRTLARETRLDAQRHGRALAALGDPLHVGGCMLYWAEGSKTRNAVIFTNSDADMVAYFLRFLRTFYAFPVGRLALSLNCHVHDGGLSLSEIERWWLTRLQLPDSSLRTHTVNNHSRASQRKRRTLPYGTARVVLCSTFAVQSIYGAIQEYTGYDRPEWIDPEASRRMELARQFSNRSVRASISRLREALKARKS